MPLPPMSRGQRLAVALAQSERALVEELTRLRKRTGLSATEVAKRINRHKSSISKFEARRADPHLSTVFRYAHAIDAMVEIRVRPFTHWEQSQTLRQVAAPAPRTWVGDRSEAAPAYSESATRTLSA